MRNKEEFMANSPHWQVHYEKGVPQTVDIPDMPLYTILRDSARRFPNKVAVRMILRYLTKGIRVGSTLTYHELDEASDRFATALYSLGVCQHDRVAIMLPNLPQYTIAFFGILKAGAIAVNTNPTYTPRELQQQLQDSGTETIITLTGLYSKVQSVSAQTSLKHTILTDVVDSLAWHWQILAARQVRATGMMTKVPRAAHVYDFYSLIRSHAPHLPTISYQADDVQVLQYTGGTTGIPKAAMLTHRNLLSNAIQIQAWLNDIRIGGEKILGALPFFHIYGLTASILTATKIAAESVMIPNPRQADLILQIIDHERISFYPAVPTMYSMLVNHPRVQEFDLHSVRACISAGAPLPDEVARRFEELTKGYLVEGYGLTETSPAAVLNPFRGKRRVGAIGVPISNTNVEIVTVEADADGNYLPVAPGEQGELVIYGPQVMKGYWNKPDETAKTINSRGGLHTGDIARMDEEGFIYIVDRKKDLIITGGYNVTPREVEEVLYMHAKVMEACVVGIPNLGRGEVVKAYIVLKPGEEATVGELRTFCKEYLTHYKVPKYIEFRKDLPKSQIGKVLRRILVEEEVTKQKAKQERVTDHLQSRHAKVQTETN
jgi:long-chain acyl-CoA synthetase